MKIVLLIRDPRGMVNSRLSKGWNLKNIKNCQSGKNCISSFLKLMNVCNTWEEYLSFKNRDFGSESDEKHWNNEVLAVRYEDLAAEPYKMADKVYKFLGMSFPDVVHDWIRLHTKNSTTTALKWKVDMENKGRWDVIEAVQNHCPKTFEYFGYKKIKNKMEILSTETIENMGCVDCKW